MANYRSASSYPSIEELRIKYSNQRESLKFMESLEKLSQQCNVPVASFLDDTIVYLQRLRTHNGIEDLLVLMDYWINHFQLINISINSQLLYRSIKAIPARSKGRVGYTFRRKPDGVFLFLF